ALHDGLFAPGQIQVRQIDAAGNPGVPAQMLAPVMVDTQQPDAPTVSTHTLSNNLAPTLSGMAEAHSVVTVSVGGAAYTLQAKEIGVWVVDLASTNRDEGTGHLFLNTNGAIGITVTATDAADNAATAASHTLTIDTTPPAAPTGVNLPAGGPKNQSENSFD